jgi:hypothetical protein
MAERIKLGRKPPHKSLAWWYLSREARQLLRQERRQGRFGGQPGKAPYWYVQEHGNVNANLRARFYIRRALDLWQPQARALVRAWLGGG